MVHPLLAELREKCKGYRCERVILRGGIHVLYWFLEDEEGVEDEFITTLTGRSAEFFKPTEQELVDLYMQAKEEVVY